MPPQSAGTMTGSVRYVCDSYGRIPFWMTVACEWCDNAKIYSQHQKPRITACIVCRLHVDALAALLHPGSEALSFLRCIRSDPDDVAPRRAFSDWLMEHGYDEIAGLFREV